MTTSLVQQDYLTISSDVGVIAQEIGPTLGNITINNSTSSNYYYTGTGIGGASGSTITISSGGTSSSSSGFTISGAGTGYDWSQSFPVDFVNAFPDWDKVQKMCEEYPGLKIAFEKFQTTYKLVVDHYDTPEDKRPKP
jgi:hypothetical protein